MTLKAFVTSLEEVPEALQDFYKQQADGRYKIDADDVEDVSALKNALQHEREERKTAKERLAELSEAFDGVDPDLAKKLLQEHEKGNRKKMIDEDRVEELIQTETEKRVAKMREKYEGEGQSLSQERDKLRSRLEVVLIDNTLQNEATKAGVLAEALPDVIRRGRERFYLHEDNVVAKDGEGNILYGADGKSSQTPGEFMEELKAGARHLFAPNKGGGASRQFNANQAGGQGGNDNVRGLERMRQARSSG
jgi:hypothetical protein